MNELKAIHKTIIVCFFLGTIGTLQALGKNTESFVTVGLLVLAGVGFAIGKIDAVQRQTNGGQEKMIKVIEEQGKRADERMATFVNIIASLPPAPHHAIEGEVKTDESETESVGVPR